MLIREVAGQIWKENEHSVNCTKKCLILHNPPKLESGTYLTACTFISFKELGEISHWDEFYATPEGHAGQGTSLPAFPRSHLTGCAFARVTGLRSAPVGCEPRFGISGEIY